MKSPGCCPVVTASAPGLRQPGQQRVPRGRRDERRGQARWLERAPSRVGGRLERVLERRGDEAEASCRLPDQDRPGRVARRGATRRSRRSDAGRHAGASASMAAISLGAEQPDPLGEAPSAFGRGWSCRRSGRRARPSAPPGLGAVQPPGLPGHQPARGRPRALRKSMTNQPCGRTVATISLEGRRVLRVMLEVAEAGEQIDREVHRAGPDRQRPHVGPHQGRVGHLARDAEQRRGQVEPDARGPRRPGRRGRGGPPRRPRRAPASRARRPSARG